MKGDEKNMENEERKIETTIKKNQEANVGKYSYKYVDIAQIHTYLESINAKYIQQTKRIENDDYIMTKRCFNDVWEDEWLQGAKVVDATLIGVKNPAQEQGSALTYARRYSLLMAFGLATEDDDAQSLSKEKEITKEIAEQYTFGFGKYNGELLKDVIATDENYINWIMANGKDEYVKKCIILLNPKFKEPTKEEQEEMSKLITKVSDLLEQTNTDREKFYNFYKVSSNSQMNLDQLKDAIKRLESKVE